MECSVVADAANSFDCAVVSDTLSFLNGTHNCTNETVNAVQDRFDMLDCIPEPNYERGFTIVLIFLVSLIGNTCTVIILSRFKIHKVPDVLVIGLALTDLLATVVPIPMSMVSYFRGVDYIEGSIVCNFFGVTAHFTRYSSIIIVSLVSLERYFAVNRPFIYRKHATPTRFSVILLFCWLIAFVLAVVPAIDPNSVISQHSGFCLFDMASYYAISVLIFAGINYVVVFVCFILVTINLLRVYRRRKKLRVQGEYNQSSRVGRRDPALTFTKPNLTSRISDLGKSIKKAGPVITEKFQLGVEAQFARMLFAVVALFYLSWTTLVILVLIAQIQRTQNGLESALFWGIRLSIISTALNPFLYGILARQYRLAYWYVVRLCLSKCFPCCVNPPLKDVFAAARNIGGEVRGDSTIRRNKYGAQHSDGGGSDYWSRNSQGVILTHTTQTLLSNNVAGFQPGNLQIIPEDYAQDHTSTAAEFSTHVPTAGELSSSVTIPQQARDRHDPYHMDMKLRGAASMHDLMDVALVELGDTNEPMAGAENPLAMITNIVNGVEVIVSPDNSDMGSDPHSPPLFSNPLYEMANTPENVKSRETMELEMAKRQQLLAASSTDDITLISKKKSLGQTRSNDVPFRSISDSKDPPFLKRPGSNTFTLGATPPVQSRLRKTGKVTTKVPDRVVSCQRKSPPMIEATDIDSGMTVLVSSSDSEVAAGKKTSLKRSPNEEIIHEEVIQPSSNRRPITLVHLDGKGLGEEQALLSQESVDLMRRNRSSSPPVMEKTDVLLLKEKFERRLVQQQSKPPRSTVTSATDSQSRTSTGIKRRNSTENSDSGRESMLDSADTVVPETPTQSSF